MSTEYDIIIKMIRNWEGGYSNDPNDRGGPTNLGITQAVLSAWRGEHVSAEDVRHLGLDEAVEIYQHRYWDAAHINLLPEAIRPVVFDIAVNMGVGEAGLMLQHALGIVGYPAVKVDGQIGPATGRASYDAIAAKGEPALVNAICDIRRNHYLGIIAAANPSQERFRHGWLRRADSFRRLPGSISSG